MRKVVLLKMLAFAIAGLLVLPSCSPAAPSPTAAPAKPTSVTLPTEGPASKPAATVSAKPAATVSAAAKSAASADWKAEWNKIVAEAKKEGKLVAAGGQGELYRNATMAFQKDYPDIQVQYTGVQGADFAPRLLAERDGGQYLWDVLTGGATSALEIFIPKGVLEPLRPALILPEVVDDKSWIGGFDNAWMDKNHQYIFGWGGTANPIVYVNRDAVPEAQFNSIDQIIDPKFKGKIVMGDPRTAGTANGQLGYLITLKGEDWVRKLFAQDPVLMKDERQMMESVIRGQYSIVFGINPAPVVQFKQEGLAQNIKPLALDNPENTVLSTGSANLMLFSKVPHPNAAKVFVNWLLSADGMQAYIAATNLNTRRIGAEGPGEYALKPGVNYTDLNKEDFVPIKTRAMEMAKEMLK